MRAIKFNEHLVHWFQMLSARDESGTITVNAICSKPHPFTNQEIAYCLLNKPVYKSPHQNDHISKISMIILSTELLQFSINYYTILYNENISEDYFFYIPYLFK